MIFFCILGGNGIVVGIFGGGGRAGVGNFGSLGICGKVGFGVGVGCGAGCGVGVGVWMVIV